MSSGRVIPPLPDISAIDDPAARQFMQALADGWNVRNGDVGSGDHQFLTRSDFKALIGTDNFNLLTNTGNNVVADANGQRTAIGGAIAGLQNSIAGSPLSVYLSTVINNISAPTSGIIARLGASEIAISTETTARINADNSLLQTVTTQFANTNAQIAAIQTTLTTLTNNQSTTASQVTLIQARIDNIGGVSLEQKFLAIATQDNYFLAQYTVKIDLNGYVVGFGLTAIDNGLGPTSQFLVRADSFAVGAPGLSSQIPFIVKTIAWTDTGGTVRPAGVYMDNAIMRAFVADTGNIGTATVGTLQIGGNAVTVPSYASTFVGGTGTAIPNTLLTAVTLQALTVDFGSIAPGAVIAVSNLQFSANTGGGGDAGFQILLFMDGVFFSIYNHTVRDGTTVSQVISGSASPSAGVHVFELKIWQISGPNQWGISLRDLYVLGSKR